MIATTQLAQNTAGGSSILTAPGSAFWCESRRAATLAATGQASYAPDGTPLPPAAPPHTIRGQPGFGAGASNSSH